MQEKNELIAYAIDFVSYLVANLKEINRIILHGSIARDDFDEKSDIDIFIDTLNKKTENKIKGILESYYKTQKYKEWKLKGIEREISIIVGNLDDDEWKNLKRAIINTGIILYGKYKALPEKAYHYTLFSFENIKPDKKRVAIYRKLFGFKLGKKRYPGLIEKSNGIKISKGSALIPIEHANELKKYLQEKKIVVKLYDLWSDIKI